MIVSEDILHAPVHELSRLLRRRKLSPVHLTEAYLERISRYGPDLHAFVTVTADLALRQARQAEREISAGLSRGPLHGIPYTASDSVAVHDHVTTWGVQQYADRMIGQDAIVITRLSNAGAVLLGKSSVTELGSSTPGAVLTPWGSERLAGGASAGSACSVAAGLAAFSLGTGTQSAILAPSSHCGVTALIPTFGRVSRDGVMIRAWTMDRVGVVCRRAADCALVLNAIKGRDTRDPMTHDAPFKPSFTKAGERIAGLRAGCVHEQAGRTVEAGIAGAFAEAVRALRSLGISAEEIQLPEYPYEAIAETITGAEEASAFESFVRSGSILGIADAERRTQLVGAQMITAADYLRCQRIRSLVAAAITELFSRIDLILAPTVQTYAPGIGADAETMINGYSPLGPVEDLLGLPAVTVPCGLSDDGLPIGVKIVGSPFAECEILETAHLFQSVTEWHLRRPEL